MSTSNDFPMPRHIALLGSSELDKEVAVELGRLEYQVITVDSYLGAPTMQLVDDHRVINMSDGPTLRRLLEETKPDLVVPKVKAIATDELTNFERHPGTRIVPNTFAVQTTVDRQDICALVASLEGAQTSKFRFASSLGGVRETLEHTGLSTFIKPTMSSSGYGQSYIVSAQEAEAAWTYALKGVRSDTGCVIVGEKVDFDLEITLLTIRSRDRKSASVATSSCAPIGHRQEHGDYVEPWQPARISPLTLKATQHMAKTVTDALVEKGAALALDLFGVEFFIKGENVWFSELSPCPHDTGVTTIASQNQSEFELHAWAIPRFPANPSPRTPGASAVVRSSQRITHSEYRDVAAASNVADAVRIFGKPVTRAGRRLGIVLATGTTAGEARRYASSGASLVSVVESREVK